MQPTSKRPPDDGPGGDAPTTGRRRLIRRTKPPPSLTGSAASSTSLPHIATDPLHDAAVNGATPQHQSRTQSGGTSSSGRSSSSGSVNSSSSGGGGGSSAGSSRRNGSDGGGGGMALVTRHAAAMGETPQVQVVGSGAEADALIRRLRQLERENTALTGTLQKICDENAGMTEQLTTLEDKIAQLAEAPLKETPVLHSLFEPEKTGWFGGSKNAAREQLEQLAEALQHEFIEYKASHASSNSEVQALVTGLHSAHSNAQELAELVHEQQEFISAGSASIVVRVVANDTAEADRLAVQRLQTDLAEERRRRDEVNAELQAKSVEVIRLLNALKDLQESTRGDKKGAEAGGRVSGDVARSSEAAATAATSGSGGNTPQASTAELQSVRDQNTRLQTELATLRDALAAEERLHRIKREESAELARKLDALQQSHTKEMSALQEQLATAHRSLANTQNTDARYASCMAELAETRAQLQTRLQELHTARTQLSELTSTQEQKVAALQARLVENQARIQELTTQLEHSVTAEEYHKTERERSALAHELELVKARIVHLEELHTRQDQLAAGATGGVAHRAGKASNGTTAEGDGGAAVREDNVPRAASGLTFQERGTPETAVPLDDEERVLELLNRNKEHLARLEFDKQQLGKQLEEVRRYAAERNEAAQRLERAAAEDKQRVAFLLKKSAAAAAELRTVTTARDGLAEQLEQQALELKQSRRSAEQLATLQQRHDELQREKQQLEGRLAATQAVEEKLVKAKETIAYMELAQSRTINMSQYAELQAEKEKLEHTVEPMRRQLEEATREAERLRAVTDAQQAVAASQKNDVQGWQDKMAALDAREAKLREKVAHLDAENARLQQLNSALEGQMADMQAGIKEMAVQMERSRDTARAAAEASLNKEMTELRAQLATAHETIANVQASQGQFIAEGLHQSVVAERDKLAEEAKRKTFDLEKLKSEILIYRQTIADLESENEEHVKEIESLQARYQGERGVLNERLVAEQKRCAEATVQLTQLNEALHTAEEKATRDAATLRDYEERDSRQRRAFEDKCRVEEQLRGELAQAQTEIAQLQQAAQSQSTAEPAARDTSDAPLAHANVSARAESSSGVSLPRQESAQSELHNAGNNEGGGGPAAPLSPVTGAEMAERLYKVQCELERVQGAYKRYRLTTEAERGEDARQIAALQAQVRGRLPADQRGAFDAETQRAAALRRSHDALLLEIETLKTQQLQQPPVPSAQASEPSSSAAAPSEARAAELQAQREAFQIAITKAIEDSEIYQRRVQELEASLAAAEAKLVLREQHVDPNTTAAATSSSDTAMALTVTEPPGASRALVPAAHPSPTAAASASSVMTAAAKQAAPPVDGVPPPTRVAATSVSHPATASGAEHDAVTPKKKIIRRIKKRRTLSEQLDLTSDGADVLLASSSTAAVGHDGSHATRAATHDLARGSQHKTDGGGGDEEGEEHSVAELRGRLAMARQELERLRKDNVAAKQTIATLTEELRVARHDLAAAQRALGEARRQSASPGEAGGEATEESAGAAAAAARTPQSGSAALAEESNRSIQRMQDLETQLHSRSDENERLHKEMRQLRAELERASVSRSAATAVIAPTTAEVGRLQRALRQKEAAISSLTAQLMPIKSKLADYMAMADRLGLSYPFPAEFEGETVLRLRAMHVHGRAVSAPAPTSGAPSSPVPAPPPATSRPGARRPHFRERHATEGM